MSLEKPHYPKRLETSNLFHLDGFTELGKISEISRGSLVTVYSQVAVIKRYLRDQVSHHRSVSFKEEYIRLLKDYGVRYNTDYPWD